MERLVNSKITDEKEQEKIFKKNITNEYVYEFLEKNDISLKKAMDYFSEFKLYQANPEKYNLIYNYDNVILQTKNNIKNEGIYYLDQEYFFNEKTLDEIDYKTNKTKADVVEVFLKNPQNGLYLTSDNGIGKTTLLTALANVYYKQSKKKTLFVFWPDFIEKTKRFSDDNVYFINKVKYAQRLIIDDLGQESITQWARDDVLHPIITFRLEKKLPTFISSNYKIEELEKIYTFRTVESKKTKSIVQKISALANQHVLVGKNHRID